MENLEKINLSDNHLSSLPSLVLVDQEGTVTAGCRNIKHIIVNNNKLDDLPERIEKLDKLLVLSVYGNNIKKLANEIWKFKNLKVLNVSSNLLVNLPMPEEDLIQQFNASMPRGGRRLSNAPTPELPGLMKTLEELYLGENRCNNEIVETVKYLPFLRILNLSYNNIIDIGTGLQNQSELQELYLSGNQLSSLPDEIDKMKRLKYLYVNCNKLSNLPAELATNHYLTVLEVSSNNLKYNVTNWPYDWNWYPKKCLLYYRYELG